MNCGEQGSNSIQRKKNYLDFLNIRCERGDFAAKDMRCSDRQSYCVWPNNISSMSSSLASVDTLGIFQ